jgi:hypothetical protein
MVQQVGATALSRRWAGGSVWSWMQKFLRHAEPVELIAQRYNFLPHSFRWRGELRRVRAVARMWEQPGAAIRPPRRYFEVVCGQGSSYILFQDLRVGTWHLSL